VRRRLTKLGAATIKAYGLPQTEADLRVRKPFEFQNWIVQQVHGSHAPRKTGDMGIDGFSFFEQPIQVKQSDRMGRNVVDNFETAIRRGGKHKGYLFAFSFTRGAPRAPPKSPFPLRRFTLVVGRRSGSVRSAV
jgi:hypothetical protein